MPFWQFFRNRLIGWIGHTLLVQPSKTVHRIFFLIYILIYFFKYETVVRSSAWSFGHSDPDPSSVFLLIFQNEMNHGSLIFFLGNAIEPIKELLRFISWFFASWIQNFRWNSTAKWQFSGGFGNLIMPIANAIDTTNQAIKAIFFISRLPWRITAVCTVVLKGNC